MKKIVIITKGENCDQVLIRLLNAIFPECEIYTNSLCTDNSRTCPNDLNRLSAADTTANTSKKGNTSVDHGSPSLSAGN